MCARRRRRRKCLESILLAQEENNKSGKYLIFLTPILYQQPLVSPSHFVSSLSVNTKRRDTRFLLVQYSPRKFDPTTPRYPVVGALQALFRAFPLNWKQQQSRERSSIHAENDPLRPPSSRRVPLTVQQTLPSQLESSATWEESGDWERNQVTREETEKDGGSSFAAIGAVTILDSYCWQSQIT